jgi:D-tyrosyl-tRNA(Tyr) deacylase
MMGVVQRVSQARVEVDGAVVGAIGAGLVVLVCAEPADTSVQVAQFLDKLLKLRIFGDAQGKMNHALPNLDGAGAVGGLLIVSQFTLAANTTGGNRPSFTAAAPAAQGRALYEELVSLARQRHPQVATGEFGAHMVLHLVNDGPVTLPLQIR